MTTLEEKIAIIIQNLTNYQTLNPSFDSAIILNNIINLYENYQNANEDTKRDAEITILRYLRCPLIHNIIKEAQKIPNPANINGAKSTIKSI